MIQLRYTAMPGERNIFRIENGDYIAEVLHGNRPEPFWYYVVRRKSSGEVLDLVRFEKYEDAVEGARKAVIEMRQAAGAD